MKTKSGLFLSCLLLSACASTIAEEVATDTAVATAQIGLKLSRVSLALTQSDLDQLNKAVASKKETTFSLSRKRKASCAAGECSVEEILKPSPEEDVQLSGTVEFDLDRDTLARLFLLRTKARRQRQTVTEESGAQKIVCTTQACEIGMAGPEEMGSL